MNMFTSYGHIKSQNKITDFLMNIAWASPFILLLKYVIEIGRRGQFL